MKFGIPESADKVVQNGLSYYFDASQLRSYSGSGTTWTNLYGTGKNGTLTNGPTFTSSFGGGIVLDGTNDFIALGDPSTNNLYSVTAITFSTWIYANYFLGSLGLMGTYTSTGANFGPRLFIGAGGGRVDAYFGIKNSGGSFVQTNTTTSLPYYTNMNLTGTYDGSNLKIYYNGSLEGTTAQTGNIYLTTGLYHSFGYSDNDAVFWNGRIYSSIMYNRALSAAEILNNYNVTKRKFGL